jgi:uncharacterized membrane protein YfcA
VFSPLDLVIAWTVSFAAAALQGVTGFGFNMVTVPILTLVNPALTPIPQIMLSLPMTVAAAWRERGDLDTRGVGWVITGRIPGAAIGAVVVTLVAERVLGGIIAVVVLIAITAIGFGAGIDLNRRNRILAGLLSGFTGTTAAIGGPPIALLYRDESGSTIRSSLGAIFTIGMSINLIALGVAGAIQPSDWMATAWLLVPMLAGYGISPRLRRRMNPTSVRTLILVVSGAAGAVLLVHSLVG